MSMRAQHFELSCEQALASWPVREPLAVLWSGGKHPASRWTVLGRPTRVVRLAAGDLGKVRDVATGRQTGAGWFVCLSYELGGVLEPAVGSTEGEWPLVTLVRCEDAWVHDGQTGSWSRVGNPPVLGQAGMSAPWRVSGLASAMGEDGYVRRVERAVEYIHAGDVYQVNLAHRLRGAFEGSARGLFRAWAATSGAWYGAYLEWDEPGRRRVVMSASPELFVKLDPSTRRIVTRPMKGTRPAGAGEHELRDSAKDRAELTMIVDLMRNDLGRVCEMGSVRVDEARRIEHHAGLGVQQATATVSGRLNDQADWWDVIRATFPGGSVTGAPKVRAMQIIRELEPVARGPYCGCVGFVADDGGFQFNIAIRTAVLEGAPAAGTLDGFASGAVSYSVGAGIVADSDPRAEWRETLDKARVFINRTSETGG